MKQALFSLTAHGSRLTLAVALLSLWFSSVTPTFAQEGCQPPVFFLGEPESGFCSGPLPSCNTILGTNITESSQIPFGTLSGTICIEGNFSISANDGFTFINATILISPGVEIVIGQGASLTLDNASLHGCDGLGEGIKMLNNSAIFTLSNTLIEDARKAINASYVSALISVDNTTFNRNYTGIWLEDSPTAPNPPYIANIYNTNFRCNAPIVGTIKEISDHGIYSLNCPVSFQYASEEDDHHVSFKGLKYGIKIDGDRPVELKGKQFIFREMLYACIRIIRGSVDLEDSHFINYGDRGIQIFRPRGLSLNNCHFRLLETDPNFFEAPSSTRWGVALGWDILDPSFIPEVHINDKSSFIYNCPSIDEDYIGVIVGSLMDLLIYDNDFTVYGQSAQGIAINGDCSDQSTFEILANRFTVTCPLSPIGDFHSWGIYTEFDMHNVHIVGNVFTGGGLAWNGDDKSFNYGIRIGNSQGLNNQITDNRFLGHFFSGATISNSSNWKICSNLGFGVSRVFDFKGDNLSIDFTHNDLVFGGFDIDGKIYLQEQKDNRFYSSIFGGSGVRCIQSNCRQFSLFPVRHPLGSEYYPEHQICGMSDNCLSASEFFINQMGPASPVCANELQDPGDEGLLLSIAGGNISDPNEYPSKQWQYENHLYAKLKNDPVLLASHTAYTTFLQNKAGTSLGQFFEVKKGMHEGLEGSNTGIDFQKLQDALSLNNSIAAPSLFEGNQKTVNQILLTSFLNQAGEFDAQQVATLKGIAMQCYKEGGHAVSQAAAALKGCDAMVIDMHQNCGEEIIPPMDLSGGTEDRVSKRRIQTSTGSLKAFSANNVLTVILPENQSGIFHLFDMNGRECYTHKAIGKEETLQLDISHFLSGIYFLSFNGNSNYTAKIILSN